jgi:membrane protease YdiL (CAAX protease family)
VIVCGYLLYRLRQLGWSDGKALTASVLVRSSYHAYGGIPLVAFTIVFGFIMGRFYQRTRRLSAIVATHALYDATLFTIAIAHNLHRLHLEPSGSPGEASLGQMRRRRVTTLP